MQYTVKNVKPTGKADTGYGTPYYVQFEEDDRIVYAQKKSEPQAGDQWDGEIVKDKYNDWKFKKAPFVPNGAAQSTTPTQSGHSFTKPSYKDNSDGQKQGMAINNAAAYVLSTSQELLSPEEWAKQVTAYAKALYQSSDLSTKESTVDEVVTVTEDPINLDTVADFFSA